MNLKIIFAMALGVSIIGCQNGTGNSSVKDLAASTPSTLRDTTLQGKIAPIGSGCDPAPGVDCSGQVAMFMLQTSSGLVLLSPSTQGISNQLSQFGLDGNPSTAQVTGHYQTISGQNVFVVDAVQAQMSY